MVLAKPVARRMSDANATRCASTTSAGISFYSTNYFTKYITHMLHTQVDILSLWEKVL